MAIGETERLVARCFCPAGFRCRSGALVGGVRAGMFCVCVSLWLAMLSGYKIVEGAGEHEVRGCYGDG